MRLALAMIPAWAAKLEVVEQSLEGLRMATFQPSGPATVRATTLSFQVFRANVCLVNAQTRVPLAQAFGGGEVASADGLRFVVPVRTLNAGPNSKYFQVERGVTY